MTHVPEPTPDTPEEKFLNLRRLQADLRALYPVPRVPPLVDARVIGAAADRLAQQRRRRALVRWAGSGAAVAAAVVAVVLHHQSPRPPPGRASVLGDIDGNGRVDILDAYKLARRIQTAPAPYEKSADVNGDGVIDHEDVELIAQMAVRVVPEPRVTAMAGGAASGGNPIQ